MAVGVANDRGIDLRLARIHLRFSALLLARAELESFVARNVIDEDGLVDLAEVRWRTGDLAAAGAAAGAALNVHPDDPLALVIAAEASVAAGAPAEARKLSARALAIAGERIDALFAGMPRSAIWPSDPQAGPAEPLATLFGPTTTSLPDRGVARTGESPSGVPPMTTDAGASPLTPATGIGAAPLPTAAPARDGRVDPDAAERDGDLSLWGSELPPETALQVAEADAAPPGATDAEDGSDIRLSGSDLDAPSAAAATSEVWPAHVGSSDETAAPASVTVPSEEASVSGVQTPPEETPVSEVASIVEADHGSTPDLSLAEAPPPQTDHVAPPEASPLDLATEIGLSRRELAEGQVSAAATRLGFALRLEPSLATEVLEILEGRHEPALELVRGDAHRALGQIVEAERSYAAARAGLVASSGEQP